MLPHAPSKTDWSDSPMLLCRSHEEPKWETFSVSVTSQSFGWHDARLIAKLTFHCGVELLATWFDDELSRMDREDLNELFDAAESLVIDRGRSIGEVIVGKWDAHRQSLDNERKE